MSACSCAESVVGLFAKIACMKTSMMKSGTFVGTALVKCRLDKMDRTCLLLAWDDAEAAKKGVAIGQLLYCPIWYHSHSHSLAVFNIRAL